MRALLIVMALVAAALVGAAVTSVMQGEEDGRPSQAPPSAGAGTTSETGAPAPEPSPVYQSTRDLGAGDCFDAIEDADDGELLAGRVVPCDVPHGEEVVGLATHPAEAGAPYPGQDVLSDWADARCNELFEKYVGVSFDNSSLDGGSIYPIREGWEGGDRGITCTAGASGAGKLSRSVRDSGL
jgi:putative regulator of septum formation